MEHDELVEGLGATYRNGPAQGLGTDMASDSALDWV